MISCSAAERIGLDSTTRSLNNLALAEGNRRQLAVRSLQLPIVGRHRHNLPNNHHHILEEDDSRHPAAADSD